MSLIKAGETDGQVFTAFYENFTHSYDVEKQRVRCIVDGGTSNTVIEVLVGPELIAPSQLN